MTPLPRLLPSLPGIAAPSYASWPVWSGSIATPIRFAPMAKKAAVRLWHRAGGFDRVTHQPGRHGGAVGHAALQVLHALIFDFLNHRTGRLDPSYSAIASKAGVCVRTVASALKRLRELGILDWVRRCAETWRDGRFVLEQETNGQHGEVRERREQLRHPAYRKPELIAERPNQVWSWDITKLMGPTKWSYFYLYVILDIFSRRVVGWCVADAESAVLFRPLFDDAIAKHNVSPGQLTLHADRGGPMKAKATALLLADLGVTRSHNRPHTSNDNPFSESHFKTLKYQPRFPQRFGCIEDAKSFCRRFFDWYNQQHHHAGIGLMTPDQVHYGQTDAIYAARQNTLDHAFRNNPERFVNKAPTPPEKPTAAWINPPASTLKIQA